MGEDVRRDLQLLIVAVVGGDGERSHARRKGESDGQQSAHAMERNSIRRGMAKKTKDSPSVHVASKFPYSVNCDVSKF